MHALIIAAMLAGDPRPACHDEHAVYHITIPKKQASSTWR